MFVKKSTYEELQEKFEALQDNYDALKKHTDRTDSELDSKYDEVSKLTEKLTTTRSKLSELESGIRKNEDVTQAVLSISDDLETVTPVSKVRPETINKLVEKQYLPYNKRNDDFAINLAVMLVGYEALEQIIFSFEEAMRNESFDDLEGYEGEDHDQA